MALPSTGSERRKQSNNAFKCVVLDEESIRYGAVRHRVSRGTPCCNSTGADGTTQPLHPERPLDATRVPVTWVDGRCAPTSRAACELAEFSE